MSDHHEGEHKHHILSDKLAGTVGVTLLIMTIITVAVARVDLGILNFPVAMLIATFKASLVVLFFMGLKYDFNENRIIFLSGVIFGTIFIVLTSTDLFFRPNDVVKGQFFDTPKGGPAKFKKPWVSAPDVVSYGKELYSVNCASCHGDQGAGDGPAAAALSPAPRDFTDGAGWIKGRKPSEVFWVLSNGLNKMPSFATLPVEDRWALSHYILSLGPSPEKDTNADLEGAGIDLSKEDGGLGSGAGAITLPIDLAIEVMAEE